MASILEYAIAKAGQESWAAHGGRHVHGFYISANLCTDHIYPNCPGLLRGFKAIRREPVKAPGVLYPEAGDVCGWCLRVWLSKNPEDAP